MMSGKPVSAPDGLKVFDVNTVLTEQKLQEFHRAGYRAAIRYVRRMPRHEYDISRVEAERILKSGLALGIVQHVAPEGWTPTLELGTQYGEIAAQECNKIGLPPGVNVWCDLEGVKVGTPARNVIDFLNSWWTRVARLGYLPGLYVGFDPGLSAQQLYQNLKFQYYWSAYNLNRDQFPAVRGVCMRQGIERTMGTVKFDPDDCAADAKGNRAVFLAPEFWPEV